MCLTAYTAPMAASSSTSVCDLMLVGDSVGMVLHGLPNTVGVTLEMMILHGQAVMRASRRAFVVVDLPFGAYEGPKEVAYANAVRVLKETGCQAVKVEAGPTVARDHRLSRAARHSGGRPRRPEAAGGQRRRRLPRQGPLARRSASGWSPRPRPPPTPARSASSSRASPRRWRGEITEAVGGPHHRHRRLGRLRRPDPGHRRHAGPVRLDAEVRAPLRQPEAPRSSRRSRAYADDVRARRFPAAAETYFGRVGG